MKLSLAYYGNPILRKKGAPIEAITDEIKKLVEDMIETVIAEDGVGLAAPQIKQSLMLFITYVPHKLAEDQWERPIKVYINPKILSHSEEVWTYPEACLSIPKLSGEITRPFQITVEFTNLEGERKTETYSGYEARVIMHENDHINGTLYIDRMHGKERREIEGALRQIKKLYN